MRDLASDVSQQPTQDADNGNSGDLAARKVDEESDSLRQAVEARLALEARQFSVPAYDRRKAMLGLAALVFAVTAGGFRLSELHFAGFSLELADERRLLIFMVGVLTYSIGDFWLFVRPEIAAWRADLASFESKYGAGVGTIDSMWKRLNAVAMRAEGSSAGSVQEIGRMRDLTRKSHSRVVRMHRLRVIWESFVPIGIASITLIIALTRLFEIVQATIV